MASVSVNPVTEACTQPSWPRIHRSEITTKKDAGFAVIPIPGHGNLKTHRLKMLKSQNRIEISVEID
jgi:hypothetical protein